MTARFDALMFMMEKNIIPLNDFVLMSQDICEKDQKGLLLYAFEMFNIPLDYMY